MAFSERRLAVRTEYLALGALELSRRLTAFGWRDEREGGWSGGIADDGCKA